MHQSQESTYDCHVLVGLVISSDVDDSGDVDSLRPEHWSVFVTDAGTSSIKTFRLHAADRVYAQACLCEASWSAIVSIVLF